MFWKICIAGDLLILIFLKIELLCQLGLTEVRISCIMHHHIWWKSVKDCVYASYPKPQQDRFLESPFEDNSPPRIYPVLI